ncbi:MAG TPA: hypothetical protein VFH90_07760 [Candidatus Limnocylindria bacterium]|nr:hypothetical protein [Candidatus Limnocylindria bacterium]
MTTVALRRPLTWLPALAALVLVISACTASSSPSASASPSAVASETTAGSASAETSPSEGPSAESTDDLGEFGCSFPVTGVGTVARAQITDVRVGTHAGYDRVVFEFDEGIPEFNLEEATPPLLADGSGMEIEVEGSAFWRLVMHGGTTVSPEGEPTYPGPFDFTPDFPTLVQLISGGDFEAVSTWYFGLEDTSCVRVLTLTAPSRLVIDIQH